MATYAMRTLWLLAETFHCVIYFAPEKVECYRAAGLKGGWMGYFASRAAALGPVGAEVVAAAFYNFHPAMVARSIPDAWSFSSPERVLEARYAAAGAALHRLLPDVVDDAFADVVAAIRPGIDSLDHAGRPLGAAHGALPWPEDPRLALWHACTVWREYRGDAHVAALVSEGVSPIAAHLTLAATGATTEEALRVNRGWSEEEWEAERTVLCERGLLGDSGGLTGEGARVRARVEALTDERSAAPWDRLSEDVARRVKRSMAAWVATIVASGGVPFPNPVGLEEQELARAVTVAR